MSHLTAPLSHILFLLRRLVAGNVVEMRHLVERGPKGYPGANFVEDAKGRLVDLSRMNDAKRKALAARLLTPVRTRKAGRGGWTVVWNEKGTLRPRCLTLYVSARVDTYDSRDRRCGGTCTTATWCS